MNRQAWLEERQSGLGATDMASLAGVGFKQPVDVYRSKVELVDMNERVHPLLLMGLATEDLNASLYTERCGYDLAKPDGIIRHPEIAWAFSTLDRENDLANPVELKYTPFFGDSWGDEMTDEVPRGYIVQTHWQMFCHNAPRADISLLSGSGEHRVYRIERDEALVDLLVKIGDEFWRMFVGPRIQPTDRWRSPMADALESACDRIAADKSLILGEDAAALAKDYLELKRIEKDAKESASKCKGKLELLIGDAEKATAGDYSIKRHAVKGGSEVSYITEPRIELRVREIKPRKA